MLFYHWYWWCYKIYKGIVKGRDQWCDKDASTKDVAREIDPVEQEKIREEIGLRGVDGGNEILNNAFFSKHQFLMTPVDTITQLTMH